MDPTLPEAKELEWTRVMFSFFSQLAFNVWILEWDIQITDHKRQPTFRGEK